MELIRTNRDLRVDFFRGLALWWIFCDHMPGNVLAWTTLHNFAPCDATEVFVLLAGYAAGLAYGRTLDRHGWLYAAADALRRAWTLYIAHIFLFVVFSAQVTYSAATLDRANYLEEMKLDVLADQPYRALFEALTLHFQPAYLDILPMYIALLVAFAFAMPLLRRPPALAALSFATYAAARLFGLNLPSWTGGGWYFNPLTWQFLFMLGAILSYAPGTPPRRPRLLDAAAVLVTALGLVEVLVIYNNPDLTGRMAPWLAHLLLSVDKTGMHPFRLVSILALAWLAARVVPAGARWLRHPVAGAFVLCGQHSLPVFCSSIALSFFGRLVMEQDDGWLAQAGVNIVGAAALLTVGAVAAWYREKGRPRPAALRGATRPDTV